MKIFQFRGALYTVNIGLLVLFIGYYTGLIDLVRDGYAVHLSTKPKRNMSKGINTKHGQIRNSHLSYEALTTDMDAQKSVDIFCPVMPFVDAVMEQWEHFKSLRPGQKLDYEKFDPFSLSKRMKFDITVHDVQVCNQMIHRILRITETTKKGSRTKGGSGFMVRSYSHYLTVCPVIDHFNGSYSVACPFYGPCTNISVILKHIHFSGFVGKTRVIERAIWQQDNICISLKDTQYGNIMTTFNSIGKLKTKDRKFKHFLGTLPKPRGDLTGELGHWLQYKNRWRWIGMNGEVLPLDNNKTLCTCYQHFKRVYLVGASHQWGNSRCLSHLCQTNEIQNEIWRQKLSPDLIKFVNETLISVSTDSANPYAFIIQFGSWDMKLYDFRDVITKYIPVFARHMEEIYASRRHQYPRVKVLVMSAPSLLDQSPKTGYSLSRNNWGSAVFAETLRRHMEDINIDFLDEFAFTFPLYTHCWCCPGKLNHHYAMWNGTTQTCSGSVGQAFMALFTSRVCPHINMV